MQDTNQHPTPGTREETTGDPGRDEQDPVTDPSAGNPSTDAGADMNGPTPPVHTGDDDDNEDEDEDE